jgi:hypothetical protein
LANPFGEANRAETIPIQFYQIRLNAPLAKACAPRDRWCDSRLESGEDIVWTTVQRLRNDEAAHGLQRGKYHFGERVRVTNISAAKCAIQRVFARKSAVQKNPLNISAERELTFKPAVSGMPLLIKMSNINSLSQTKPVKSLVRRFLPE